MEEIGPGEKARIVELVRGGFGENMACRSLGIHTRKLRRARESDPEFAADLRDAFNYRRENNVYLILQRARGDPGDDGQPTKDPDYDLLKFLINRDDNVESRHEKRRDDKQANKQAAELARQQFDLFLDAAVEVIPARSRKAVLNRLNQKLAKLGLPVR